MGRRSDVVVLLSGGVDSVVLAQEALNQGRLRAVVHCVYPHPAQSKERGAVMEVCRHWHMQGHFVERRDMDLALHSYGDLAIGIGQEGPRVVPGRNLIFLSLAVNYAAGLGASEVWIGCTDEDQAEYPDCRQGFIDSVNDMSKAWGIFVRAPFIEKRRDEILDIGRANGSPIKHTWSCYEPTMTGRACGTCNSCLQGSW